MTEQAAPGEKPEQQETSSETMQDAHNNANNADPKTAPAPAPRPAVQSLLSMFPNMDRTTVETVLEAHAGDSNAAVTVLLSMNDPEYRPSEQDTQAVHSAELARRTETIHLRSPFQSQTWDPQKLTYQPRVRRPHGASINRSPNQSTVHRTTEPLSYRNRDLSEYEARIASAAADGMARVGTKLSQLRQRAESTLKNLPEGGVRQKIQESPLFRRAPPGTPDRHSRARTQMNSASLGAGNSYPYDNDPELVGELDLDQILAAPLPEPRKDKKDGWGQRYTKAEGPEKKRSVPSMALEGWDAVGRADIDGNAPEVPPKGAGDAKGKQAQVDNSIPESKGGPEFMDQSTSMKPDEKPSDPIQPIPVNAADSTDDTKSLDKSSDDTRDKTDAEPSTERGTDSGSDQEYVSNPFEDDD